MGGYDNGGLATATNKTWAYNVTSQTWRQMDSIPIELGVTHMPIVFVGSNIYACGGFVNGTSPGLPARKECFMYSHENALGSQWTRIPDLPDIRAGGAMFYDSIRNSIFYATGADFHSPNPPRPVDWSTVWELSLANPIAWTARSASPYKANHVGFTTVVYQGVERHFMMGGQEAHNEWSGQLNRTYEYVSTTDTWIQRASMLSGTSHIQSSVIPYNNCGVLVVGGKNNLASVSSDVVYYDIGTNTWSKIGTTPTSISASVCDVIDGYLYCQTGCIGCKFSYRIPIG
jgi:N-acetylneuraminic acid mutarotase